jgi:flagellar motor component MotA
MKKSKVIFKSITKYWFYIGIIIIIIIAIFNIVLAIWLTLISVVLFIISSIPSLFFAKNVVKLMENYYKIEDEMIARELKRPLEKVQEKMYDLAQNQENKAWLIVYLNKRYIFYHQDIVKKFIKLYKEGQGEKEILEELLENDIQTRSEIKMIKDTLIKYQRLR